MTSKPDPETINPLSFESVNHNKAQLTYIRSICALAFGTAAGILRLESYGGFLFYFLFSSIIGLLIFIIKCNANRSKASTYFTSTKDIFIEGVPGAIASFILAWALFYTLVDV